MKEAPYRISVAAILTTGAAGKLLGLFAPLLDRLLGVARFRRMYERDGLRGLERYSFVERFIEKEGIRYSFDPEAIAAIPPRGPVVVVANHPLGGLEGILLTYLLRLARPDYKVVVNVMMLFVRELRDFFIFVNPMAKGSAANSRALGEARSWLAQGHCLLVFPAGRVGHYRPEKGYVTDEPWDQLAVSLGIMTRATFVPVYVQAQSSALFSLLSEYIFPMKLLFLVREFNRSLGQRVAFHVGPPIPHTRLAAMGRRRANAWLRMRCFLECPAEAAPERRRGSSARGRLHPEVEDYLERYGEAEGELV